MKGLPYRTAWLKGSEVCPDIRTDSLHAYRFVLLGAPGVGKGTQAELLFERFGICPLSTGEIFRAARTDSDPRERTSAMSRALRHMASGELVPDEIVLSLVKERRKCLRCSGGFLLDGFPRTVAQAEALDEMLKADEMNLDAVLDYELPLETIVARLGGRRTCSNCKKVFHVESLPPKRAGICDSCGTVLIQRDDDRPEAVRVRMEAYQRSTLPLTEFYRRKGILVAIQCGDTPDETFERTLDQLKRVLPNRRPVLPNSPG